MNLESRIKKLESQHREREAADAPPQRQYADHAADGSVTACVRLTWPSIRQQREQGMSGFDAMRLVYREPFNRESCQYSDCEYRDTCSADGRATSWGAS